MHLFRRFVLWNYFVHSKNMLNKGTIIHSWLVTEEIMLRMIFHKSKLNRQYFKLFLRQWFFSFLDDIFAKCWKDENNYANFSPTLKYKQVVSSYQPWLCEGPISLLTRGSLLCQNWIFLDFVCSEIWTSDYGKTHSANQVCCMVHVCFAVATKYDP